MGQLEKDCRKLKGKISWQMFECVCACERVKESHTIKSTSIKSCLVTAQCTQLTVWKLRCFQRVCQRGDTHELFTFVFHLLTQVALDFLTVHHFDLQVLINTCHLIIINNETWPIAFYLIPMTFYIHTGQITHF